MNSTARHQECVHFLLHTASAHFQCTHYILVLQNKIYTKITPIRSYNLLLQIVTYENTIEKSQSMQEIFNFSI